MATVTVEAGICGFTTKIRADRLGKYQVRLIVETDCKHIEKMAQELTEVNALEEISARKDGQIRSLFRQFGAHGACPVPAGMIKAVEVAAGLALPRDAVIRVSGED